MSIVFKDLLWKISLCFLDDIIVYAMTHRNYSNVYTQFSTVCEM